MKELSLKDILIPINGTVTQGLINRRIKNVNILKKRIRKNRVEDETLYFDFYRKSNLDFIKNYPNIIFVTDRDFKLENRQDITIVNVPNVNKAYWAFVNYYRDLFDIPVIFVTGTCGKTTTKEMIKHILQEIYKVEATDKSKNSLSYNLGYLCEITDKTQAAVYETGVAYPGDLSNYGRYFKPHVGVILNIGIDHLDRCGNIENYTKEKARMMDVLNNKGTLILNADDENIKKIDLSNYKGEIRYFGFGNKCHFRASDVKYYKNGMQFTLKYRKLNVPAFIPGYGEHNVYNALAAIAAANSVGIRIRDAVQRLKSFKHIERHLELSDGINGSLIIDDTWSTNPTSCETALKVLNELSNGKTKIAVLGKMSLLGDTLTTWNSYIADKIIENDIDILITIGDGADKIGEITGKKGMNNNKIYMCRDAEEVYEVLKRKLDKNIIVLVKTSMLAEYGVSLINMIKKIRVKKAKVLF